MGVVHDQRAVGNIDPSVVVLFGIQSRMSEEGQVCGAAGAVLDRLSASRADASLCTTQAPPRKDWIVHVLLLRECNVPCETLVVLRAHSLTTPGWDKVRYNQSIMHVKSRRCATVHAYADFRARAWNEKSSQRCTRLSGRVAELLNKTMSLRFMCFKCRQWALGLMVAAEQY